MREASPTTSTLFEGDSRGGDLGEAFSINSTLFEGDSGGGGLSEGLLGDSISDPFVGVSTKPTLLVGEVLSSRSFKRSLSPVSGGLERSGKCSFSGASFAMEIIFGGDLSGDVLGDFLGDLLWALLGGDLSGDVLGDLLRVLLDGDLSGDVLGDLLRVLLDGVLTEGGGFFLPRFRGDFFPGIFARLSWCIGKERRGLRLRLGVASRGWSVKNSSSCVESITTGSGFSTRSRTSCVDSTTASNSIG